MQNNSCVFYSSFCNCNEPKKKTDDFELSLSLSFTHTQKKRKEVSLSFSLSPLARAPTTRRGQTNAPLVFSRLRKQHRGRLMTFVCLCVQLVFDFEETKGMKDYCLGFSVENSKMFKNRLCRRFFHTSSSSSERCLVTHARTTHAYHPYSRR